MAKRSTKWICDKPYCNYTTVVEESASIHSYQYNHTMTRVWNVLNE